MIVVVRWPWLSLLAAQIALIVVFLLYVVVDTALTGVVVVKSSNIAELKAIAKREKDGSSLSTESLLAGGIAAEVDATVKGKLVENLEGWNLDVHSEGTSNKGSVDEQGQ